MKLSYSAMQTYRTCPLQYYYRYVEGKPSIPTPALSLGISLHEALRWFYDVPTCEPHTLEELLDYLEVCWVTERYRSKEEEVRYFLQAKSTLELYYRHNAPIFRTPVALEQKFSIDLGFCELTGRIDRMDKDPDGGFEIIDYKTNRRLPPASKLKKDLQMPIYHMAAQELWEIAPKKVTFYFIIMNHRHSYTISQEMLSQAVREIEAVCREIEKEQFSPVRNNLCPWCDYVELCPEVTQAQIGVRREQHPEIDIGEAVDELMLSQKQVSTKLSRIEALKSIVSSYLLETGLEKIGGSKCIAYFDEDGSLAWEEIDDEKNHFS
ncbi:MAG: PD-(D/E)XK nuclease family protein [Actinomycetota bacterium]|nr:PD-(D/E)XK nuclease family protein [Actinomycetota bacterium]